MINRSKGVQLGCKTGSFKWSLLLWGAMIVVGGLPTTAWAVDLNGASKAVVKLFVTHQSWSMTQPWSKNNSVRSTCTGFFIKEGILTNAHCVTDSTYIQIELPGVPDKVEGIRKAINHQLDLALIELKDPSQRPADITPITFDPLPELRDKVVTVGYPTGGRQVSYTEGVVSRIDIMKYAYSRVSSLMVQTDAAINSGNSGGPVFSDTTGASLGVATQRSRKGSGMGYFIPTEVINQFLKDIEDGTVDGVPTLGGFFQPLENPALRDFLGMTEEQSGGRLLEAAQGNSMDGILSRGDVLIAIDGHQVFNDGRVPFREEGKIGLSYHVVLHQVGEKLKLKVLRQGKVKNLVVTLKPNNVYLIPAMPQFETQPRFFEIAGMVFRPVERRYMSSLGKSLSVGIKQYMGKTFGDVGIDELVVIGNVFDASVNKGYRGHVENSRVFEINGHPIKKLADVEKAFSSAKKREFHEILLADNWSIVLDKKQVEEDQLGIRERYEIGESHL